MATFVYALAILLVSAACYGVCWLLGYRPKFKSVSYVIAHIFLFAPLVVLGMLIAAAFTAVVIAVLALVLDLTGHLATVKGWSFWQYLPAKAWFAIVVVVSYIAFMIYSWRDEIAKWYRGRR